MICRGCGSVLTLTFLNLGYSPIANNLIENPKSKFENDIYPLKAMTCDSCALVQLSEKIPREILFKSNYVYHSSVSSSWLKHSELFSHRMVQELELNQNDLVIEVASNDGYLLQFFKRLGIQVLGIEPAVDVAMLALNNGIPTEIDFFGKSLALNLIQIKRPKLIIGNNVLAHVPDLHDFIDGIEILLDDEGLATFEFPHLLNLIRNNQFDTIYHEHYSYLSLTSLLPLFEKRDLKIFNVEKLPTHGGSLRIFVAKKNSSWSVNKSIYSILNSEKVFDPRKKNIYKPFQNKVMNIKNNLVSELTSQTKKRMRISAYGAAAKGITLLNYCGIKSDLIKYVVDLNPSKQGKFLPGSLIPIVAPKHLITEPPDILLVLPWNIASEIKLQLRDQINSGMKLLRAIPEVEYF